MQTYIYMLMVKTLFQMNPSLEHNPDPA